MKLNSLFTRGTITAKPKATVGSIAALMESHNVGAVVIEEDRRPVGIITDRDLALALGVHGHTRDTLAQTIMTRHVLAIPGDTDLFTATQFLRESGVRRLPVVDDNDCVVGIVTLDDLIGLLGRELANVAESVKHEVHVR